MRLGKILKAYRMHNEMSQRDLAKETGISYPTICRIEQGRSIDADTLRHVINWLMDPSFKYGGQS